MTALVVVLVVLLPFAVAGAYARGRCTEAGERAWAWQRIREEWAYINRAHAELNRRHAAVVSLERQWNFPSKKDEVRS